MIDEADQEERDWEEACRREDAIRTLLNGRTSTVATKEVEEAAVELGLSRATLYRMIGRYRDGGTVSSLLPRSVGRPKKSRSLAPEREALISIALLAALSRTQNDPDLYKRMESSCSGRESIRFDSVKIKLLADAHPSFSYLHTTVRLGK